MENKFEVIPNGSKPSQWLIARLASVVLVFLSLFFVYVKEKFKVSDHIDIPSNFDPFNMRDQVTTFHFKGFNLIFDANKLSLYTGGAWLIFIATLALITISILVLVSIYNHNHLYSIIKEEHYKLIKMIGEGVLLAGFVFILLGAMFSSVVSVGFGFVLGLLLTIGLYVINFLETKRLI